MIHVLDENSKHFDINDSDFNIIAILCGGGVGGDFHNSETQPFTKQNMNIL